jgi:hypothetical protein
MRIIMPITPTQGPSSGGNTVVITGTNLSNASAVRFGTNLATITSNTATQIDVTAPAGHGVVGVRVTTPGGTSNPLSYFYVEPPIKTDVSPTSGSSAGGDTVIITGAGLTTASTVNFGPANPGTITAVNDGQITVTSPAHAAGTVSVTVTTAGGTVDGLTFTYVDDPTVTAVNPNSGPEEGGNSVTLTGTNLTTTTALTFNGAAASFNVLSDTQIGATVPAGTGAATVGVTTAASPTPFTFTGLYSYTPGPGA